MNIAIEARSLSAKGGGVKTYTQELINHLPAALADEDNAGVIVSGEASIENRKISKHTIPLKSEALLPLWLSYNVPRELKKIKPSVVHFTKAAIPTKSVFPTVVTIYDVIPLLLPESQAISRRLYWPHALRHAAQKSNAVITISETSKKDIVRLLEVNPEKITVTPLAVNRQLAEPVSNGKKQEVLQKLQLASPYILFVGTRDMRKNVAALIRVFAIIAKDFPHELVIAGKNALKIDEAVGAAEKSGYASRIRFLDFVDTEDLSSLYAGADLFVWPSVYEGWGFPPQEAMATGTPVIVSNGGSLPEVVGDAGVIVPFSTENLLERLNDNVFEKNLAVKMASVLSDDTVRELAKKEGPLQAGRYSWDAVARKTYEVYKSVAI